MLLALLGSAAAVQATRGWAVDMKNRGYDTIDGGEALTGRVHKPSSASSFSAADLGSTVLRSARRLKDDISEEEAMKKAMLERAAAKMK